jgi:uncharacterized protein YndB with AHSA1/START domain
MTNILEEAVVRKSVRVQAPIERAFSVFVEQMETWWPPQHHIAPEPFQAIFVEPRVGGRWYERDAKGSQCEWGTVLAWDPPQRVSLSWHLGSDFKFNPDLAFASEVEIRFTSNDSSTLVELEHRGLERHGEGYQQLRAIMDGPGAWVATLAAYANVIDHPKPAEENEESR